MLHVVYYAIYMMYILWIKFLFCPQVWNVAKPYIDKYQMEYIPESRPISPTAFSLESPASPRKRCRQEWMVQFFFIIVKNL